MREHLEEAYKDAPVQTISDETVDIRKLSEDVLEGNKSIEDVIGKVQKSYHLPPANVISQTLYLNTPTAPIIGSRYDVNESRYEFQIVNDTLYLDKDDVVRIVGEKYLTTGKIGNEEIGQLWDCLY